MVMSLCTAGGAGHGKLTAACVSGHSVGQSGLLVVGGECVVIIFEKVFL